MSWAAEELKTASLGDKRRNRRLIKIVEDLSAMPIASVTQAARDGAAVQGINPLGVPLGVLHHSCMGEREKPTINSQQSSLTKTV
jgi:hypothetical protein